MPNHDTRDSATKDPSSSPETLGIFPPRSEELNRDLSWSARARSKPVLSLHVVSPFLATSALPLFPARGGFGWGRPENPGSRSQAKVKQPPVSWRRNGERGPRSLLGEGVLGHFNQKGGVKEMEHAGPGRGSGNKILGINSSYFSACLCYPGQS